MAIRSNRAVAPAASTAASTDDSDASSASVTPIDTKGKKRGGNWGPRGPSLRWAGSRKKALVLVMRRIDADKLEGPLTTVNVASYLNGAKQIPADMEDLQDLVMSFKGVEELITPAKLNAERNKIDEVLTSNGKRGLPEFERTRRMTNPDEFDDLE